MVDLARGLLLRTEDGDLQWDPHPTSPGQFDTVVAGSMVSIASSHPDGNHPFVLVLWDREGATRPEDPTAVEKLGVLEKLTTSDLLIGEPDGWQRLLARLWRAARTQALKVDERLDAILAQLQGPALAGCCISNQG